MDVQAMIVPFITEFVPRVTADPAAQKMFCACAPPVKTTWLVDSVVIEVALRMTKTALEFPCPFRYRIPPGEISMDVPDS